MIAPGQSLRACFVVVAASLPGVQAGSPRVSTSPCLSNQIVTVSSTGGGEPSSVAILPKPCRRIGAKPCLGSVGGEKPPSVVITRFEACSVIASAEPTATSSNATATPVALNKLFLTEFPLRSPVRQTTSRGKQDRQGGEASPEGIARARAAVAPAASPRRPRGRRPPPRGPRAGPHRSQRPHSPDGDRSSRHRILPWQRTAARTLRRLGSVRDPARMPPGGGQPPGTAADPRPAAGAAGDHALPLGHRRRRTLAAPAEPRPDPGRFPRRKQGCGQGDGAAPEPGSGRADPRSGGGDPDRLRKPLACPPGRKPEGERAGRADRLPLPV